METSLYPTYFANTMRNSFVNRSTRISGSPEWKAGKPASDEDQPRALFTWADHVAVESESTLRLFDKNVTQLWSRTKAGGSPAAVGDSLAYYQDEQFYLTGVDIGGKARLSDADFPNAVDPAFQVALLAPRKDDFLAVIQFTGGPEGLSPKVYVEATRYGRNLSAWVKELDGTQVLEPLYIPAQERLIVFLDDIIFFDANTGNEISRHPYIIAPAGCCADTSGNLYMIGAPAGKNMLVMMSAAGQEVWRWEDNSSSAPVKNGRRPILGTANQVFLLIGTSVIALTAGKQDWTFDTEGPSPDYGTALADGSLLVTAGNMLYRLDNEGNAVLEADAESRILTPPVIDAEGSIFVATASELLRLK